MAKPKTNIPLYDLKLPEIAIRNARRTLKDGWLSTGKNVQQFESMLADKLGVKHTIATNSATSALTATLSALGLRGREIITTPFTFVATAESIIQAGAKPVLADINPNRLNLDPDSVSKRINAKTAAIVPVDIAGHPCDYTALIKIARQHGLKLIVDASHSLGALYNNKSMAQIGDAAVYSFHATKNLVCGEGGLIATADRKLASQARLICRHGITTIAAERKARATTSYDVITLGFKGTMSELHASVGLGHLTRFDSNQTQRTRLASRYLSRLARYESHLSLPPLDRNSIPAWHLFIIRLKLDRWKIDRDRFIKEMADRGIECGVHFKPLFEFSYYRQPASLLKRLAHAKTAGQQVVSLPLYSTLLLKSVDQVVASIGELIDRFGR